MIQSTDKFLIFFGIWAKNSMNKQLWEFLNKYDIVVFVVFKDDFCESAVLANFLWKNLEIV